MNVIEQGLRDIRHAWRTIAGMPVLATVVVVSLGIGIGVNTAVFSWIQMFVFKPIPGVDGAGRFHSIEARAEAGSFPGTSWLEYRDLQGALQSFEEVVAFRMTALNLGEPPRIERVYALLVSGNYFTGLGLTPARGRFLRADEVVRPGGEPVAVVSYDFWQTRFAGRDDAIGQTVRVNNVDLVVVGVTPEGFQGTVLGLQFDLWVPATLAPPLLAGSRELEQRNLRGYQVIGTLRDGRSRAQAEAEVQAFMRQLAQLYPESNAGMQGAVLPFWQAPRGPQMMFLQALLVLQGLMLLLLLAVCGNTANLLLARALSRQREVGVRLAVGASPWRVIRLLVVEHVLLALAGAALGVILAMWGTQALRAVPFATMGLPIRFQSSVDLLGLAVAVLLALGAALVFGLPPALQLSRVDPHRALGSSQRALPRRHLRNALMAAQVALALAVLLVAGLFLRSFSETRLLDPGFRREGVLLAAYDLSGRGLESAQARDFAARLLERLRAIPGVESAAIATSVPLDIHGLPLAGFTLEGRARTDGAVDRALRNTVTSGYFTTMGIPILEGTDFAEIADAAAPPQAIVNDEFVRRFVQDGQAIGRKITAGTRDYVITGVVRNSMSESFGEQAIPVIYYSYRDRPPTGGEMHIRTRVGGETLIAGDVRRVVRDLDASLPVYNVRTMAEHVETNLVLRRIPARMFVVLGPLLLLLAAIGIYAVVAYTVAHRTSEIGVRIALGATGQRVVAQMVKESLRVIAAGAAAGWLAVFAVYIHLVRPAPIYLTIFAGIPALLLAVAALACWLPARRATRVDPVIALRAE
jgi:predicted permease